jgi:solute:Na+ symporter, SSS family
MHYLDVTVILIYILSLLFIGLRFYKKDQSSYSFTLGDNKIPAWVISLSIFATFVSSISYLALPGIAYQKNWNSFVFSLSIPLASIVAVRYFVPVFRKVNSPSAYAFLEIRFGAWARTYAASMYLLTQVMRVGTILYLMALIPYTLFGWDIITIIIITSLITMVYSMMGGIQAVVWADAIQAIVLMLGAIICLFIIIDKIPGGLPEIIDTGISNNKFSLGNFGLDLSDATFWVVLSYGFFINLQNFGADQNYIQRYMSSRSLADAQKSAFWGSLLYIPVSLLFLFIGTSLFTLYQTDVLVLPPELQEIQNSDRVFPHFIANELPNGLRGLLIASIFAAGMSTISTSYNSSATIILTDFQSVYSKQNQTERRKMNILYVSTLIISLLGMVVAMAMINTKSALDTWWKLASVFSGGILGLFLLGIINKSTHNRAAIVGVVAGLLIIVWLTLSNLYLPKETFGNQFHSYLVIVFGTSTIFIVGFLMGLLFNNKRT